ncbi:hypothetical protein B0H13DRAFT_1855071 [Mycena leptocephala]|nr:hypothetical protein B0H13DRAFT_1855071 [Mycena leptocephala]
MGKQRLNGCTTACTPPPQQPYSPPCPPSTPSQQASGDTVVSFSELRDKKSDFSTLQSQISGSRQYHEKPTVHVGKLPLLPVPADRPARPCRHHPNLEALARLVTQKFRNGGLFLVVLGLVPSVLQVLLLLGVIVEHCKPVEESERAWVVELGEFGQDGEKWFVVDVDSVCIDIPAECSSLCSQCETLPLHFGVGGMEERMKIVQ